MQLDLWPNKIISLEPNLYENLYAFFNIGLRQPMNSTLLYIICCKWSDDPQLCRELSLLLTVAVATSCGDDDTQIPSPRPNSLGSVLGWAESVVEEPPLPFSLVVRDHIYRNKVPCMMLSHPSKCLKDIRNKNKKHVGSLKYVGGGWWGI